MDRRGNNAPNYQANPLFAVAHYLLVNIRMVLFFFYDIGRTNLAGHTERLVQFIRSQGGVLSQSVEEGFNKLCQGELVHDLNRLVTGLLRFSTRNNGNCRLVDCAVKEADLRELYEGQRIPVRIQNLVGSNLGNLQTAYYADESQQHATDRTQSTSGTREPTFEEEMSKRLNDNAENAGPQRRFGGPFSRPTVPDISLHDENAPSSSSSNRGTARIEESSSSPQEAPAPRRAPTNVDALEGYTNRRGNNEEDARGGGPTEQLELRPSSCSLRQPSTVADNASGSVENFIRTADEVESSLPRTSQQPTSLPIETEERSFSDVPSTSKKVSFPQRYSPSYFVSAGYRPDPPASDYRKELMNKVKQKIAQDSVMQNSRTQSESTESDDDANARRIMNKLLVPPGNSNDVENYPQTSNYFVEGCGPSCSCRNATTSDVHKSNDKEMARCAICDYDICPEHKFLRCHECNETYHTKCLAWTALMMKVCLNCLAIFESDRSPYE